jgi:hypothetical protein
VKIQMVIFRIMISFVRYMGMNFTDQHNDFIIGLKYTLNISSDVVYTLLYN